MAGALPYRLEGTGDIAGSAALWASLGAPFDQAMALAQGTVEQRQQSIQIFVRMGATAPAHKLAEDLRREGHAQAPARPRLSTLQNPLGLTNRQMDVLRALSEGLSNHDIGARLFVPPKTIDHHVSAILAKLEVASRGEAAAKARMLSLI